MIGRCEILAGGGCNIIKNIPEIRAHLLAQTGIELKLIEIRDTVCNNSTEQQRLSDCPIYSGPYGIKLVENYKKANGK